MREMTRTLGISTVLFLALSPRLAHADLTGDFADALQVDTEFVTGVSSATDIAFAADGRAVVTQKGGTIVVRRTDGTKNVVTGAFGTVDTNSEKGLLGVVAHPTEENTFFFYVSNGDDDSDKHHVYKGTLGDDDTVTIDLDNPIIAASADSGPGLEGPANHDGGGLFIHDNYLFVGVGDTGSNATPPQNKYGSCLNKGNGKILRVALDGSVPADNPLVGVDEVTACDSPRGDWATDAPDERIYAWGFRNPWRFWVDPHTDRMWIGDVGETTREEVSLSTPIGDGWMGAHFGYPFVEGTQDYDELDGKNCETGMSPAADCVGPIHDYDNDSVGNCVIGGIIPEGCGWSDAFGGKLYYFFADYGAAWIHALEVKADRSGVVSSEAIDAGEFSGAGPASFRQGPEGAMYVVMNAGNAVYEIKPKQQTGEDCQSSGGTGGTGGTDGGSPDAGMSNGGTDAGESGASNAGTAGTSQAGRGGTAGRGGSGGSGTAGRGGSGTAGTAGSAGTAGTSSGAGGSSSGDDDAGDDDGCGCRVAGKRENSVPALLGMLGLAGAALLRRRARR